MIFHPETDFVDRRQAQCVNNFRPLFEQWALAEAIEILAVSEYGDRLLFREIGKPITENTLDQSAVYRKLTNLTGPDRALRRYDQVGNHGGTARFGWCGIEEPSEQPVFHQFWFAGKEHLEKWAGSWWFDAITPLVRPGTYIVEIDYDFYSKVRDLKGIFGHLFGEIVVPRVGSLVKRRGRKRTDPFKIRQELIRKRGFDVELAA